MEPLRKKVADVLSAYTGRWGIVIANAATGDRLELNPDMIFPAASMIKVPIMYEIMRQAAAGKLSLDAALRINDEDKVGGAGILKELQAGKVFTVRELVTLMIILSDNMATNMLIDLIGTETVNQTAAELGLKSTVLRRRMMDFAAAQAGKENQTSAADMALIFAKIHTSAGLPRAYGGLMLDILGRQQIQDKLPFYLPGGITLAHKTGTLAGVEHDAGILYLPGGPYIISVLTGDLPVNYLGLQLVAALGKVVYEHFA